MKYNPYLSIWFNPKKTIISILNGDTKFRFYIPIILTIFSAVIGRFDDIFVLLEPPYAIFALVLLIGLMYWVVAHIFPWLVLMSGKIWKGKSGFPELQIVIGLAQIPVLLIIAEQVVFSMFGDVIPDWETNIVIQWLTWIFYMRIFIIGVALTQGFNYTISLLNIIVGILPVFIIRLFFL